MYWTITANKHLCTLKVFSINGKKADASEFGKGYDARPDLADDYGCGDYVFAPLPPTEKVLKKYSISESDYKKICEALAERLSFGRCSECH